MQGIFGEVKPVGKIAGHDVYTVEQYVSMHPMHREEIRAITGIPMGITTNLTIHPNIRQHLLKMIKWFYLEEKPIHKT